MSDQFEPLKANSLPTPLIRSTNMKLNRRSFLSSSMVALSTAGLPVLSSGQSSPPPRHLIGERDDVPDVVTPLGIRLNTGAFEQARWKRQRKSERWLLERGVPAEWVHAADDAIYDQNAPDFYRWCCDLWNLPGLLAYWTDVAYTSAVHSLVYRHLHYTPPSGIRVIVEPGPFFAADGQWRMSWIDGRWGGPVIARVVIIHVSLQSDPNHARVRTFRNEVVWAFQNQLK